MCVLDGVKSAGISWCPHLCVILAPKVSVKVLVNSDVNLKLLQLFKSALWAIMTAEMSFCSQNHCHVQRSSLRFCDTQHGFQTEADCAAAHNKSPDDSCNRLIISLVSD